MQGNIRRRAWSFEEDSRLKQILENCSQPIDWKGLEEQLIRATGDKTLKQIKSRLYNKMVSKLTPTPGDQ